MSKALPEPHIFWAINPENGKLSPEIIDTYIFLQQRGYTKRKIGDEVELYKQTGHLVEESYANDQVNEVITFLRDEYKKNTELTIDYDRKGEITYEYTPKQVLEKFAKFGWGKLFNEKNFNHLPELNANIKRHTRDKAFFYFKNGYVEITRNGSQFQPYSSIGTQCIFKDHLINRDIELWDINDKVNQDFAPKGTQFFDFMGKISGGDSDKLRYLFESIGFLLHDYRQQGLTDHCVIFCDDNSGGSGKGILIQALRQMTKVTELDAKKGERFDPDELNERTRIKVINDIPSTYQFTDVYNEITDQAQLRHMHKTPRGIPYADVWKVLITSNHIVRGNSGPDLRRQRVFSMNAFFNQKHSPRDEYDHSFFSTDWSDKDWNFFYNTMFECVRYWLATDYKLEYNDVEYAQLKMEEEYPTELRDFAEEIINAVRHNGTQTHKTSDLFFQFKMHPKYSLSPFVRKLNSKFFSMKFRDYLDELKVKNSRNHNRTEITIWIEKK